MRIQRTFYAVTLGFSASSLIAKVQSFSLTSNTIKSNTAYSQQRSRVITNTNEKRWEVAFESLSQNPLLFQSTQPILDPNECSILSSWCQHILQTKGVFNEDALSEGIANEQEGALLLRRVQHILHEELLGLEDNEEMVMPRYISYREDDNGNENKDPSDYTVAELLPDGLHVDTNNSKHFRHWTILLYLDSCDTLGATTFPLAIPERIDDQKKRSEEASDNEVVGEAELRAATKLIFEENVQHTRFVDATEKQLALGKIVEAPSLNLLTSKDEYGHGADATSTAMGVRVAPKHGHYCLFSGLSSDGYPNPRSFHGGEAMYHGESKEVLTFFYEVPVGTFGSRAELGQRAKEREEAFIQRHGL